MGHALVDQKKIQRLEYENERLRSALRQISLDCYKVMSDEICSEAERRTWKAVGDMAYHAANA